MDCVTAERDLDPSKTTTTRSTIPTTHHLLRVLLLHQDFDDPSGTRLWRTTTTHVDEAGVGSQDVRLYRVRGSVELAGEQVGERITAYEPALLELPADVGPGSSWSSAGTVSGTQAYTSRFSASAGAQGCLDVSGELVAGSVERTVYYWVRRRS